MDLNTLTALSPLDGRYELKLAALRPIFSEFGLIFHRVLVEIRWLQFLSNHKEITGFPTFSAEQQNALNRVIDEFTFDDANDIKKIEQETNHDVKAIEYFLQKKLKQLGDFSAAYPFIHFACTSEDINNLAYALMLEKGRKELSLSMQEIIAKLHDLAMANAEIPMLTRTHGQPASPSTVGKEFINITMRLQRQYDQFQNCTLLGKFNGAVGNYNAHQAAYPHVNWPEFSKKFVISLGLEWNPYTTQIEPHDFIAEWLHVLIRFNNILIDMNRDFWGYISLNYFQQRKVDKEVGSSTMPHKINPIDFENGEGNLGLANTLADHMANKLPISRWQRDLTDSTVLRNLGLIFGYSMLSYLSTLRGLNKLEVNTTEIHKDLDHHWEVLTEAVQTVMRRYGDANAYENLKAFSRGRKVDQILLHDFIAQLNIPDDEKQRLQKLTPSTYIGFAVKLTQEFEHYLKKNLE